MTSPTASVALQQQQSGALAELTQETMALTRRLFLQLMRRPSTLIAGVLQPLIWLILFGVSSGLNHLHAFCMKAL